jgi:phosphohistidine phosphatase
MTLTLILIRHCKSDWTAGATSDHARPLNPRGRRDAPRIGKWLASQGLAPTAALCSDARRTQETWAAIADQLQTPPAPTLSRTLYLAEPAQMLDALYRTRDHATVAMIGHNPGIGALAWTLADAAPDHPRFADYPTGATTVLSFPVPTWREIMTGTVTHFTTPHDLPD